ncbi:hypothetical protein BMAPRL20_A2854 [Burkholderia mallei PRL-20]|nr:hypothetical protein GBP346_A3937 [Burkholderia pseudomallei MSHR346]EBA45404.1 hypothetical protein BURPS305_2025 [Burkholderia pseudomallei 305]EDK84271.1 hypothetical protein BMA721280_E0603 [Burkholderia mallei 2002721280]EDP86266.1 hypothetical protein BMA10399_D0369 [Burkholderia mallei ATCC 10399]EDS88024.1 hypothetical protein BURPSS13_S0016 [Burkholderia pseudomallei S13]EEC32284.1 hypothetical protein BUC_4050 [Burkholderia pseudomallei 576]EES43105.1 hypothetical protein BMAPRL2
MIDGWHCLFLKLTKIDTSNSGKAKSDVRDAPKRVRDA